MEWTDVLIAQLREFWSQGLSTAEIGRRLGVSKNAVVGKAHRLVLAPRPSPIRRAGGGSTRPARRASGPTLPSFAPSPPADAGPPRPESVAPTMARADFGRQRPQDRIADRIAERAAPVLVPARRELPRALRDPLAGGGRVISCCWPLGEPGTAGFRFCGDGSIPGKPYCVAHAQLAYVKVRDRREDAA